MQAKYRKVKAILCNKQFCTLKQVKKRPCFIISQNKANQKYTTINLSSKDANSKKFNRPSILTFSRKDKNNKIISYINTPLRFINNTHKFEKDFYSMQLQDFVLVLVWLFLLCVI